MSDKAKIKKEVTIVLRALLLSAPMGLTAVEIDRDFREAQGYGVPYRELGYNSTSDLVEALPEVASCIWERGHAVFRAVADKTTRHIQSLVSKQNVDVRKCLKRRNAIERSVSRSGSGRSYSYNPSANRGRSQPYYRSGRGGGAGGGNNWKRTSSYPPGDLEDDHNIPAGPFGGNKQKSRTVSIPSTSPAYLRTQLKTLLTSHPNGILNTHFASIFSRKFGFPIDYAKLGFAGLPGLVKSLHSVLSVEHLGEDRFRIYSIENFPKGKENALRPTPQAPAPAPRVIPRYNPDATKSVPFQKVQSPQKTSYASSATVTTAPTGSGRARRPLSQRTSETSSRSRSTESAANLQEPSAPSSELIDRLLAEEIQQVLSQHPEGVFAANLPSEYKALTKKELPLISIGFYSVVELVSAIPEIVAIERQKKNSDWKLFDSRTYKATKSPEPERKQKEDSASSDSADDSRLAEEKSKVRDVLLAHPTGVLLQDLPAFYEKYFKKPLPCEEFGVSDVNSLVLAIPDTIKVVYKGKNKVYLHAQDQRFPNGGLLYSSVAKSIPQDAVGYGYSYHPAKRPKLNEYFPIWVSTVYTPHKISIQIKDKEINTALERLMDNLEAVYHYPEGEKYLMPDAMIAVNQICCALFQEDNNWHRGLITGVPNIDLVEVLYVDYGTSISVPKKSLRLLKSCFMQLPMAAIDAKLAGIEPPGEKWSNECRDRLLELSYDKPLLAYAVEEKRAAMSLLLCDTSTDEDIHINDLLVSEGLAKFVEEVKPEPEAVPELLPSESTIEPPTSELSLQMLTGMGLPVPEDDPSQAFQWPDESQEVQQIMRAGPAGDGQFTNPEGTDFAKDMNAGQLEKEQPESSADSGPPPLQDGGEMENELVGEMAKELSEIEENPESVQQVPWIVEKIELITGQTLHLISFGGHGQYVTSVEIVHLIWSQDMDENALFDLIEQKNAELGQVIVEEIDNEDLANSLAGEGVPLSPTQPSRLQLFLITSVPSLMYVSGQASPDFINQLKSIADEMPPLEDDDFSRESASSETSGSADVDMDLAELNKTYDVLRTRRERILKDLMSNTGVGNVDDLTYIEGVMRDIEEKIERRKASRGTISSSVDDLSGQLGQTTLGSSISLASGDDVFNSPQAFTDGMLPHEMNMRDNQSQTVGYGQQARHASDRTGLGPKRTAMISPLQRKSTGSALPPQRGVGRGAASPAKPTGMGRGHPHPVGQMDVPMRMQFSQDMDLPSLNPNVPEFVPTLKSDGSESGELPPSVNIFQPPPTMMMNPFARPPSSVAPPMGGMHPPMGRGARSVPLVPPPMPFPPTKPVMMPNMSQFSRKPTPMRDPMFAPPSLVGPGNAPYMPPLDLPPFPPPMGQAPGQGLTLPADFTLLPMGPPQMFDPNMPPPHMYGLGRGSQKWSNND